MNKCLLISVLLLFGLVLFSCNDDNSTLEKVKIYGVVRTIDFMRVKEEIYYKKEKIASTNENGEFKISIPKKDGVVLLSSLGLKEKSLTYKLQNWDEGRVEIIKLLDNMNIKDFYMLSGKVVMHSDGESVVSGVELRIDGTTIKTTNNDRNFDVGPIYCKSIISVFKENFVFVDAKFKPFNEVCLEEELNYISEMVMIEINGYPTELKHYTGLTFRLADVEL